MTDEIQHVTLEARAERLVLLAETAAAIDRSSHVADGGGARQLKASFAATRGRWLLEDEEALVADRVSLSDAHWTRLRHALEQAKPYSRMFVEEPAFAEEPRDLLMPQELEDLIARLPRTMSRRDCALIERSAERLVRLDRLGAAAVFIANEVRILRNALSLAYGAEPILPHFDASVPEVEGDSLLVWALEPCLVTEPTNCGAINVGLWNSGVALGQASRPSADKLHELWQTRRPPSHPYVSSPCLSRRLLFGASSWFPESLDGAGPIFWAAGDELAMMGQGLMGFAATQPSGLAEEIRHFAERLRKLHARGRGIVGWLEYQPSEAEGHGSCMVDWTCRA